MAIVEYTVHISYNRYSEQTLDNMCEYCIHRFGIDSTVWGGYDIMYHSKSMIFRFHSEEDRTEFKLKWLYDPDDTFN